MEGAAERSEAGLASFFRGEAATFIPHSSFEQSFSPQSMSALPMG